MESAAAAPIAAAAATMHLLDPSPLQEPAEEAQHPAALVVAGAVQLRRTNALTHWLNC